MRLYDEVEKLADKMKDPTFDINSVKIKDSTIAKFFNKRCQNRLSLTRILQEVIEHKGLL